MSPVNYVSRWRVRHQFTCEQCDDTLKCHNCRGEGYSDAGEWCAVCESRGMCRICADLPPICITATLTNGVVSVNLAIVDGFANAFYSSLSDYRQLNDLITSHVNRIVEQIRSV